MSSVNLASFFRCALLLTLSLSLCLSITAESSADMQLLAFGGSKHRSKPKRSYSLPAQAEGDIEPALLEEEEPLDEGTTQTIPASSEADGIFPPAIDSSAGLSATADAPQIKMRTISRVETVAPLTGTVTLNFSDAALKDVLRTIAEITGENFIVAPGVSAKISVQTTKPVQKKDVFGIFESVLDLNGLAAVKTGSYYKIVSAQNAKQHGVGLVNGSKELPAGDGVTNLIVPVEFISANDLMQLLKPMSSPSGNIVNYSKTNTLILTDTGSNIRKFVEIIKAIDVDAFQKMNIAFVPVKNVDVKTFGKEVSDVFNAMGMGKDTAQLSMVTIERLNSIMLFSASQQLLDSARQWIERLDTSANGEVSSVHIYYVRNDKASTIKTILDQLYGEKKGPALPGAGQTQAAQAPPLVSRPDNPGEIKIFLYEPQNALVINSSQRDYEKILVSLLELDKPPKQVLIDALISEIKLDDETKYGVQWSALMGNVNVQQNTGISSSTLTDPQLKIIPPIGQAAPMGLSILATDAQKFFAVIQALASKGKLNVLSNPHIVVKNYEKASINIGSDEPVATQSTQTAVTGTAGVIQNIEYRKTGVILTVTPHITEGGMVSLSIRQEVSDKSTDRTVGNAIYPSFSKREAETSVVAKDRETLVIGGLIQDRQNKSTSGIPLLSDIPIIGGLFRYTNNTDSKTELIILITPSVIANPEQAASVTEEARRKLGALQEYMNRKKAEGN